MDNKTIALVGALLVLGVALYGMATGNVPGFSGFNEETPEEQNGGTDDGGTQNVNDGQDGNGGQTDDGGGNVSDGGGGNETDDGEDEIEELAEGTEFTEEQLRGMNSSRVEELLRRAELTPVCENQGEDYEGEQGSVRVRGPPFNPFMFESMVHDRINEVRESRTGAEPFDCDPELRERARGHSEVIAEEDEDDDVEIQEPELRYEGVCENPRERTIEGLYYLRDTELDSPEGDVSQERTRIENHDQLLLEVQRDWLTGGGMELVTDRSATRQGVGAYIDRDTQEVVVTYVVC